MRFSFALFIGAAIPVCVSLPAHAFQSAGRCFAAPALAPAADVRIAELTRMLRNPSMTTRTQACMLFARGLLQHFNGDPQSAIEDYTRAIGWMRDPTAVYEMRGDAYADAGAPDKADADYAKAAQGKPDAKTLGNLCWVRGLRGRPLDRALDDCDLALKQKPEDDNAREARCLVGYRLHNFAQAIADCGAVLKEKPDSAGALYIRGLAKRHAGDEAGAKEDIAAASRANARTPDFFALVGVKD